MTPRCAIDAAVLTTEGLIAGLPPLSVHIGDVDADRREMAAWVKENIRGKCEIHWSAWVVYLQFDNDEDAILFKLRWC